MTVLVVDHKLPFAELASRLQAAGWRRTGEPGEPGAPEPLIEGEPEDGEWLGDDARLRYYFEPATGLRALYLSGPRAGDAASALAQQLPCRGFDDARALLGAPDVESRLRGLQMVEVLEAYELLDGAAALADDANRTVAQRARLTCSRLALLATDEAVAFLAQWKQDNPEKSAVFLLAGSAPARSQVLRWLARTQRTSNAHIDAVLRTALDDADWEVRMTAIAVAGRLRANAVIKAVAATRLPEDTADGVNQDERRMLGTIKLCAIELMQGAAVPPADREPPTTRERMHAHLLRCLAGQPVTHHEKAFSYLRSLSEPLPDDAPEPAHLPPGIVRQEDGYLLEARGVELCWVAPVEHRLGEELQRMQVENPIRSARSAGFFIAREAGESRTYEQSIAHCRELATATGLDIRLPTADEWEMAVRGPDGRRFPWGNNARGELQFGPSPWGVAGAVGRAAEWTSTSHGEDVLVCGGKEQWVCAMRTPEHRESAHALRFVIGLDGY